MGFADMLIRLGIPYDSEEAVNTGEQIMKFLKTEEREKSEELARERGVFRTIREANTIVSTAQDSGTRP